MTAAAFLAGGAVAAVIALSLSSAAPPEVPAAAATDQASADSARPGECTYRTGYTPVSVRPEPSFNPELRRQTVNGVGQLVIGACQPVRGERGFGNGPEKTGNCGAGAVGDDNWVRIRSPHPGWVFLPCLSVNSSAR